MGSESIMWPSCFQCCYHCIVEMQSDKLLILKLSIPLPIHSRWWVPHIATITQGISLASLFIIHTQILLPHGSYKRHKGQSGKATYSQQRPQRLITQVIWQGKPHAGKASLRRPDQGWGQGVGNVEGPILTSSNLSIRTRRGLRPSHSSTSLCIGEN